MTLALLLSLAFIVGTASTTVYATYLAIKFQEGKEQ
jgi:hypothetical protein